LAKSVKLRQEAAAVKARELSKVLVFTPSEKLQTKKLS